MRLVVGLRAVLCAGGHHEQLTGAELDIVVERGPDELAPGHGQLQLVAVHVAHDLGPEDLVEARQLVGQVHLVVHGRSVEWPPWTGSTSTGAAPASRSCSCTGSATPGGGGSRCCRCSSPASTCWRSTCPASAAGRAAAWGGIRPRRGPAADSVEGAMDAAGFERAHVAGNSLGGRDRPGAGATRTRHHGHRHLPRGPGLGARGGVGRRGVAGDALGHPERAGAAVVLRNVAGLRHPAGRPAARPPAPGAPTRTT